MDPIYQSGIEFCFKALLRTGVALLRTRITLEQVASLGIAPLMKVVRAFVFTIRLDACLDDGVGKASG